MNRLFLDEDDLPLESTVDDDLDIEQEPSLDEDVELEIEPDVPLPAAKDPAPTPMALAEILPPGFVIGPLTQFVPNVSLRVTADAAADYALTIPVEGADGLQRADLALTAVRSTLKAIEAHLEDPIQIAHKLHKRLTSVRTEWMAHGTTVVDSVGKAIFAEQRRLEQIALDARRQAQSEADARERAAAQREADAAAAAQAPALVVEELKRQALTATAAPVQGPAVAPVLRGSSTVTTWKCRLIGTPGSDEPNPKMADLTPAQRAHVMTLMKAVLEGKAPLAFFELNWGVMNKRAQAERSALAVPGLESVELGSVRAKSGRTT